MGRLPGGGVQGGPPKGEGTFLGTLQLGLWCCPPPQLYPHEGPRPGVSVCHAQPGACTHTPRAWPLAGCGASTHPPGLGGAPLTATPVTESSQTVASPVERWGPEAGAGSPSPHWLCVLQDFLEEASKLRPEDTVRCRTSVADARGASRAGWGELGSRYGGHVGPALEAARVNHFQVALTPPAWSLCFLLPLRPAQEEPRGAGPGVPGFAPRREWPCSCCCCCCLAGLSPRLAG